MRRPDRGISWLRARAAVVEVSIPAVVHPRANEALLPPSEWRRLAPLASYGFACSRAVALARGDRAIGLVLRGDLLVRDAAIDAEPASVIAGASSRGWITPREQPRRSRGITTELLGLVARQCAGPTVRSFGFVTELAQTMMRIASYIRVANGTLKRPSDLRRLAPLAIMRLACRLASALCIHTVSTT